MNVARTLATTGRVLGQIRHDPRTIGLLLVVPSLLIGLVAWIFTDTDVFATIGPAMIALFPFIVMFLVTSIATLRERRSGTLERLFSMPMGKGDFILGYALAFGLLAGRFGDRWNLGFLAETERQVESHLKSHLERLPAGDIKSRAIVEQMKADEAGHAETAVRLGARALPAPVRGAMKLAAKVMTTTAYRI